jgi:flagellar biosynthesis component FlhA
LGVLELIKKFLTPFLGVSTVKQLIDSVEDGAELAIILQNLGISREQGVQMVKMLVDFLKETVSPETVQKITEQVPAIKVFMGEAKKEE